MVTITLLILFDKKKYEANILPALDKLKIGNIKEVENLITKLNKDIVVDFWDFSDIPEEDDEFTDFFEDFILAIEEEIAEHKSFPQTMDKDILRKMIVNTVKGYKGEKDIIPEEIIKRMMFASDNLVEFKNDDIIINNQIFDSKPNKEELSSEDLIDPEDDVDQIEILSLEMADILDVVKKDKKADSDALMYFKARFIEGFCIPVNKVSYRFDLSGNLLNVFLYSLSGSLKNLFRNKNALDKLPPILPDKEKEIAEDIFDRYLNQDNISKIVHTLNRLIQTYNTDNEFEKVDKALNTRIKGGWWNRMSYNDKQIRVKNWWDELDKLKMFLQGALDHGYDILISNI